jgi:hypothetical protein
MPLISDLITIPDRVHKGDFVLRLTEGVDRADETIDTYVATPELVKNFDDALAFIKSAVESRSSKATYLDGSFGSGKSHFMAILHLLLRAYPRARSIPELASIVAKHNGWMDGKRFLLIPYHMIGARSLESAVLGHYVEYVRKLHPEAPMPGVYVAESLFRDAQTVRKAMGDEAFFNQLNSGKNNGGGSWGDLEREWDSRRFESAVAAAAGSEDRALLVGDLIGTVLTSYATAMQGQDEVYVPLDQGLPIISHHAQELGYNAIILFLDELILWLASHAADSSFIAEEVQKIPKLVEAQVADRPVPIVSFIARQRDLRELVGEHVPGAQQLAFTDLLGYFEGRLNRIGLLDRNLPAIAQKRVLAPKSDTARKQIDAAFDELTRVRQEVLETLLTARADRDMFRQVYPFSPALMETLVAVSSLLQRERTAIKVMLQLLVNQRDTLNLGDLVPVGDLFDVIAEGDEPFSEGMRQHFENAKHLYHQKLLPLLEAEHRIRMEEVKQLPFGDPKAVAFRVDSRLMKTLLLAALVPEVEPLKNLTAHRLAALNHGSIRSPIPGQEGQMVLARARRWAAAIGEIKIGEEANPTISLQISGVDTEGILEKARVVDNSGERLRKIRELLFKDFGIDNREELFLSHDFLWRNTTRTCDVVFANVRELPHESLRAREERWKVVIDFPFDEPNYTPRDDLAKVLEYRERNEPTNTILWIPSFFTRAAQKDLGTLVILDHILAGERFNDYASHLSTVDRAAARSLLDNQRSQLREQVRGYLQGAYGIATPTPGSVDESHELGEHVQSLNPTFHPRLPVGQDLGGGLRNLLDQALSHQYPAHPTFEVEVRLPALKRVYAEIERAADDPQHRVLVDRAVRPVMRQIAMPLRLGDMGETHFVLSDFWRNHFLRKKAQDGGALTVEKMRAWTDEPEPRGLQPWVQNLLILTFATQENYSFLLHGGPAGEVSLDSLKNELVLEPVALPSLEDWALAIERVAPILGIDAPKLRNANNASALAEQIHGQLKAMRGDCEKLSQRLRERMRYFGLAPESAPRMQTAAAIQTLVESVANAPVESVVAAVARAELRTSAAAMGSSLKKAGVVSAGLDGINWEIFDGIAQLTDSRAQEAAAIRERVVDALAADEYATALIPALQRAQSDALRLITRPVEPPPPPPPPQPKPRKEIRLEGQEADVPLERAQEVFSEIDAALRQGRGVDPILRRFSGSDKLMPCGTECVCLYPDSSPSSSPGSVG